MVAAVTSPLALASQMISPNPAAQAAPSQAGAAGAPATAASASAVPPGDAAPAAGPPSSDQMKARIAGLVADLVQREKLSRGQARDLHDLFAGVLAKGAQSAAAASPAQPGDEGQGGLPALVQGFARAAQAPPGGYAPDGRSAAPASAPLVVNYKS